MSIPKAEATSSSLLAGLASSFDHAPWAVTEVSGAAHVVRYANAAFCELINKAPDEVVGRTFDKLLPPTDACLALVERVFRTGAAESYTAEDQATASSLLFSYNLSPVMANGRTAGVMIQVNETGPLHDTRKAISQALLLGALRQDELIEAADSVNARLRAEIIDGIQRENDANMLTNEITHRVKNNLQVVVGLIANEIRRTPEPWVQGYQAMQDRILAIARLYDLVSQSSRDRTVALDAYLREIAATLSRSLLGNTPGIRIAVEAEALQIDSERAIPFGLMVNELCTNAVKHAFSGGSGLVTLGLRRIEDEIELRITDDGIGMATPCDVSPLGKHGYDYVAIFVRQIHGALIKSTGLSGGTAFSVRFPMSPDSSVRPPCDKTLKS